MPMIGARFYTQFDSSLLWGDMIEGELEKVRLLCKKTILTTFQGAGEWATFPTDIEDEHGSVSATGGGGVRSGAVLVRVRRAAAGPTLQKLFIPPAHGPGQSFPFYFSRHFFAQQGTLALANNKD